MERTVDRVNDRSKEQTTDTELHYIKQHHMDGWMDGTTE